MKYKMTAAMERQGSSNGAGKCYLLCFKGEDGKSYQAWTDDRLGNFKRWYDVICAFTGAKNRGEELWFSGLSRRRGSANQIDADSQFKIEVFSPSVLPDPNTYFPPPAERPRKDLE